MHAVTLLNDNLCRTQLKFCHYIRSPLAQNKPAELNTRRLNVYRDLVFNNIESLLAGTLPVTKSILSKADPDRDANPWTELVRDFISSGHSKTPLFTQLARAFLNFTQGHRFVENVPFLPELVEYELLEPELLYTDSATHADSSIAFEQARLAISPTACLRQYRFPVHQLSPSFLLLEPPENSTHLLLSRNASFAIQFHILAPVAFQLLKLISENPGYGVQEWLKIFSESGGLTEQPNHTVTGAHAFLRQFFTCGAIYALPHGVTEPRSNDRSLSKTHSSKGD